MSVNNIDRMRCDAQPIPNLADDGEYKRWINRALTSRVSFINYLYPLSIIVLNERQKIGQTIIIFMMMVMANTRSRQKCRGEVRLRECRTIFVVVAYIYYISWFTALTLK